MNHVYEPLSIWDMSDVFAWEDLSMHVSNFNFYCDVCAEQ